ncbi:MAG: hypothetical protein QME27_08545, partial [Syntrophaceae bacterium]|nr:hypothetical protein [Syntrophaceae bacterium]
NYSRYGYGSFSKYCVDRSTIEKLPDGIIGADIYSASMVGDGIVARTTVGATAASILSVSRIESITETIR